MLDKDTPNSRVDARRAADPDAPTPGTEAREVHPHPKTAPDPESAPNPKTEPDPASNAEKDPSDWVSGGEPMTGAQASYLKTLSEETGASAYRDDLTKAEASTLIDELKNARNQKR